MINMGLGLFEIWKVIVAEKYRWIWNKMKT